MKAEKELAAKAIEANETLPAEQLAWSDELFALLKAVDESGAPKLSLEEIEDYLERPLGGIVAAYPDGIAAHPKV